MKVFKIVSDSDCENSLQMYQLGKDEILIECGILNEDEFVYRGQVCISKQDALDLAKELRMIAKNLED